MNDRVFFLSAVLLAVLLVLVALQPATYALPSGSVSGGDTDYSQITIEGPELNRVIAGGESRINLLGEGRDRTLRIETQAGTLSDDPARGPHYRLAADLEVAFEQQKLEITIRARSSSRYPAEAFIANYAAGRDGESGWMQFQLSEDYANYTFTYEVPARGTSLGVDYLGIRPVTPERRRAIEIESVSMRRLGRWTED